jgi:hypothetical protein
LEEDYLFRDLVGRTFELPRRGERQQLAEVRGDGGKRTAGSEARPEQPKRSTDTDCWIVQTERLDLHALVGRQGGQRIRAEAALEVGVYCIEDRPIDQIALI